MFPYLIEEGTKGRGRGAIWRQGKAKRRLGGGTRRRGGGKGSPTPKKGAAVVFNKKTIPRVSGKAPVGRLCATTRQCQGAFAPWSMVGTLVHMCTSAKVPVGHSCTAQGAAAAENVRKEDREGKRMRGKEGKGSGPD